MWATISSSRSGLTWTSRMHAECRQHGTLLADLPPAAVEHAAAETNLDRVDDLAGIDASSVSTKDRELSGHVRKRGFAVESAQQPVRAPIEPIEREPH
jgi:hypothetical protein